jgi:hypothetical protein
MKDVQATGEANSLQMRTSRTSKQHISSLFSVFCGHFCPPGSGSSRQKSMVDPDPDPQPWQLLYGLFNIMYSPYT